MAFFEDTARDEWDRKRDAAPGAAPMTTGEIGGAASSASGASQGPAAPAATQGTGYVNVGSYFGANTGAPGAQLDAARAALDPRIQKAETDWYGLTGSAVDRANAAIDPIRSELDSYREKATTGEGTTAGERALSAANFARGAGGEWDALMSQFDSRLNGIPTMAQAESTYVPEEHGKQTSTLAPTGQSPQKVPGDVTVSKKGGDAPAPTVAPVKRSQPLSVAAGGIPEWTARPSRIAEAFGAPDPRLKKSFRRA